MERTGNEDILAQRLAALAAKRQAEAKEQKSGEGDLGKGLPESTVSTEDTNTRLSAVAFSLQPAPTDSDESRKTLKHEDRERDLLSSLPAERKGRAKSPTSDLAEYKSDILGISGIVDHTLSSPFSQRSSFAGLGSRQQATYENVSSRGQHTVSDKRKSQLMEEIQDLLRTLDDLNRELHEQPKKSKKASQKKSEGDDGKKPLLDVSAELFLEISRVEARLAAVRTEVATIERQEEPVYDRVDDPFQFGGAGRDSRMYTDMSGGLGLNRDTYTPMTRQLSSMPTIGAAKQRDSTATMSLLQRAPGLVPEDIQVPHPANKVADETCSAGFIANTAWTPVFPILIALGWFNYTAWKSPEHQVVQHNSWSSVEAGLFIGNAATSLILGLLHAHQNFVDTSNTKQEWREALFNSQLQAVRETLNRTMETRSPEYIALNNFISTHLDEQSETFGATAMWNVLHGLNSLVFAGYPIEIVNRFLNNFEFYGESKQLQKLLRKAIARYEEELKFLNECDGHSLEGQQLKELSMTNMAGIQASLARIHNGLAEIPTGYSTVNRGLSPSKYNTASYVVNIFIMVALSIAAGVHLLSEDQTLAGALLLGMFIEGCNLAASYTRVKGHETNLEGDGDSTTLIRNVIKKAQRPLLSNGYNGNIVECLLALSAGVHDNMNNVVSRFFIDSSAYSELKRTLVQLNDIAGASSERIPAAIMKDYLYNVIESAAQAAEAALAQFAHYLENRSDELDVESAERGKIIALANSYVSQIWNLICKVGKTNSIRSVDNPFMEFKDDGTAVDHIMLQLNEVQTPGDKNIHASLILLGTEGQNGDDLSKFNAQLTLDDVKHITTKFGMQDTSSLHLLSCLMQAKAIQEEDILTTYMRIVENKEARYAKIAEVHDDNDTIQSVINSTSQSEPVPVEQAVRRNDGQASDDVVAPNGDDVPSDGKCCGGCFTFISRSTGTGGSSRTHVPGNMRMGGSGI